MPPTKPRFSAGQDMFVAGDAADSMIVIVDGEAEAKCKNGKVVPCPWIMDSFFFPNVSQIAKNYTCYRDPFEFITKRFNEFQLSRLHG